MEQTTNRTGSTQRLFIGNLSTQATEDQLRSMVGEFGTVKDVYLVRAVTTGMVLGFAFVEVADEQEAARAIAALDGVDFDGRTLRVRPRF